RFLLIAVALCYFFFSSRRRHTRFSRDWSSDVCSSDLEFGVAPSGHERGAGGRGVQADEGAHGGGLPRAVGAEEARDVPGGDGERSEERRVGKEGRDRCSPGQQQISAICIWTRMR